MLPCITPAFRRRGARRRKARVFRTVHLNDFRASFPLPTLRRGNTRDNPTTTTRSTGMENSTT
ncbi:hypothetical protein C5O80_25645 [Burkholderia sp. SRS-46]|nr:hypothetical protein C5O80_25645 [Burkholderia sp. SRS-46]